MAMTVLSSLLDGIDKSIIIWFPLDKLFRFEYNNRHMEEVFCSECKSILASQKDRCIFCGSNKKTIKITIEDTMHGIFDRLKLKIKDKTKNAKKNPVIEIFHGFDLYIKTGEMVKKTRNIDSRNNKYYEDVKKLDGTVLHHCEEKLTDHNKNVSRKNQFPKIKND
jgi:RNA polymerase subunit RPABC4/transcription elongation factor Spt4